MNEFKSEALLPSFLHAVVPIAIAIPVVSILVHVVIQLESSVKCKFLETKMA